MSSMHLPHGQFVENGVDMIAITRFTWIQPGKRYLDDAEKSYTLARWREDQKNTDTGSGADGRPDPAVFDLVDRINAVRGLCVVQSCSGHPAHWDGDHDLIGGQLWIRADEFMSALIRNRAHELAADERVYRFGALYLPHGLEVWWLVFQGWARRVVSGEPARESVGGVPFADVSDRIVEFFETLA